MKILKEAEIILKKFLRVDTTEGALWFSWDHSSRLGSRRRRPRCRISLLSFIRHIKKLLSKASLSLL